MRNSIILTSAIAIMLIGMVGSAVVLLDEERLKGMIITQAERSTGRKVEILGSVRVRFFPSLQLSAETIEFRRPDAPDAAPRFAAERLDMRLRLLPMLRARPVPEEVRLSGARLMLRSGEEGLADRLGGPDPEIAVSPDRLTQAGPVIVEDLLIEVTDQDDQLRQSFALEQVQLSGFAPNRPLAFSFDGNFGEPALFDRLEVTGRMVTDPAGRIELSPMRLRGSLEQGRYVIELSGDLDFRPGVEAAMVLRDGRLAVNQHRFGLDLDWRSLARPHVVASLSAERIDVDVLAVLDQLARLPHEPGRQPLLAALKATDLDLDLSLARVAEQGLVLEDFNATLSARDGRLLLRRLQAAAPGAYLTAEAELDLVLAEPRWQAGFALDLARAERLFAFLGQAHGPSGAGRLQLDLSSVGAGQDPRELPWQGSGMLMLWDGAWPLLGWLKSVAGLESVASEFEWLSSDLVLGPRRIEWPQWQAGGADWLVQGRLEVGLFESDLLGDVLLTDGLGATRLLELAGSLPQPDLLVPPLLVANPE